MSSIMISIIDYGVGNLRSVEKAFHFIGRNAQITGDSRTILQSDGIVLPGVGAFDDAMKSLKASGLDQTVKDAVKSGKPFLGICLGMQLLFDYSEEGGEHVEGLGILKGSIRQLPAYAGLKVPHMGWNSLDLLGGCPYFSHLPEKPYVYFVHSYRLKADDRSIVAAASHYGETFDAAVYSKNIFATQFHPEKSGETGLKILKNWSAAITESI